MQINATSGISRAVVWLMSVISGLVVANNYYNQPLLALIADDLHVTESAASKIYLDYPYG